MGKNHARTGVAAVAVLGTAGVAWQWMPAVAAVPALAAGIIVGGSVMPDLDVRGATVTRSFGPATEVISALTRVSARAVYTISRGAGDPKRRRAHRLLTHTAAGNLLAGLLLATVCSIGTAHGPLPAAIAIGLVVGIGAYALDKGWKWLAALVAGVLAYATPGVDTTWIWAWGGALALGCAVHCLGDSCTVQGTPYWWPLGGDRRNRKWITRWVLPEALRVETGQLGERVVMFFVVTLTLGLCAVIIVLGV